MKKPVVLSIAGFDPSGGAGTIADVKAISAFGCFPAAAITSITFQNTQKVFGAVHTKAEDLKAQLDPIFDDFEIAAVKTGMLPTPDSIRLAAEMLSEKEHGWLVVDPVVRSTSGYDLINNEALEELKKALFPLADLITPNLPEAERISGIAIEAQDDIRDAARQMLDMGAKAVLIKGGHRSLNSKAVDYLFTSTAETEFTGEYILTNATHGTGCVLSSAIAANLALGKSLEEAIRISKSFVNAGIRNSPKLGKGNSPIEVGLTGQVE